MASRLKLIRKELGLTQEVLAQKLGVGKSALSMIETGKAALSERNKNILVQELNVGEGRSRYDAVVDWHPHTVCTCCGQVGDLHMDALKNVSQKLAPELDFEVEMEQLILYGKCSACRKK